MIRLATFDDVDTMIDIAELFVSESRYHSLKFDGNVLGEYIESLIDSDSGFVAVAVDEADQVVGGILGVLVNNFYSLDMIAQDSGLFVLPSHRKSRVGMDLVNALKAWGKENNAVFTQVGVTAGINNKGADSLMVRLGGENVGSLFEFANG